MDPETSSDAQVMAPPDLPPGDHPLEVAARGGMGPLSPLGRAIWHGEAVPCVSCGQLVRRGRRECDHCGQDLSLDMLAKMRAYAGPWYVYEHVRPFPGVTFERLIRQIRRGLLTETSIVRGPATDHQWRFAGETPGLSRYFGRCWNCHGQVTLADSTCPGCRAILLADRPATEPATPALRPSEPSSLIDPDVFDDDGAEPQHPEWLALKAALEAAPSASHNPVAVAPPNPVGFRTAWIIIGITVMMMAGLLVVVSVRNRLTRAPQPAASPQLAVPAERPR